MLERPSIKQYDVGHGVVTTVGIIQNFVFSAAANFVFITGDARIAISDAINWLLEFTVFFLALAKRKLLLYHAV